MKYGLFFPTTTTPERVECSWSAVLAAARDLLGVERLVHDDTRVSGWDGGGSYWLHESHDDGCGSVEVRRIS